MAALGGAVGDLGLMPGDDLGSPAAHGAAELTDLGRTVVVAHVLGELVDPLEREVGVAVGVELADSLLLACQAVATSPWGSPGASSPVSLPWACSSRRSVNRGGSRRGHGVPWVRWSRVVGFSCCRADGASGIVS